jgi:sterol desaturase/sphingolipid hydroxylase (fatty acid hydroxylase superfamily)
MPLDRLISARGGYNGSAAETAAGIGKKMRQFVEDVRDRPALALGLAGLVLAALAAGTAAPLALAQASRKYPPFAETLTALGIELEPSAFLLPAGMVAVTLCCLAIEAIGLGYRDSTLHRLLAAISPTLRTDLFYFALRISGATAALAFAFSLGSVYALADAVESAFGLGLLAPVDSFPVQFAAVVVANSLSFYVFHRLMHTKLLWEVHKVHHSAEDYNVLLPYRNHPIDHVGATLFGAFFAAVLGARPDVVVAWIVANAFYQSMVHSRLDWKWRWLEHVFITPQAHRVHHSLAPEHYNRNFGILTFWDRLFGTYCPPVPGPLAIGVAERERFNTDRHVRELFRVILRWLGLEKAGLDSR